MAAVVCVGVKAIAGWRRRIGLRIPMRQHRSLAFGELQILNATGRISESGRGRIGTTTTTSSALSGHDGIICEAQLNWNSRCWR
jgi:hypothetical protein